MEEETEGQREKHETIVGGVTYLNSFQYMILKCVMPSIVYALASKTALFVLPKYTMLRTLTVCFLIYQMNMSPRNKYIMNELIKRNNYVYFKFSENTELSLFNIMLIIPFIKHGDPFF